MLIGIYIVYIPIIIQYLKQYKAIKKKFNFEEILKHLIKNLNLERYYD